MKNILVVDDDLTQQILIESICKKFCHDCKVHVAGSGEEALEICKKITFNVAFVDVMMPGMNGIELTRRLRSQGKHGMIVICTADMSQSTRSSSINAGADTVIIKPIDCHVIMALINMRSYKK